jgi:glycopeptide antibiotics resistance protein
MSIIVDEAATHLWPVGLGILIILLLIGWRRTRSLSYLTCCAAFGVYLLFVVDAVIFPIRIISDFVGGEMRLSLWVNLIPLNFDLSFIPHIVLMQIFQNILLTVPFGFGVNFITPVRARHIVWMTLVVGLGIETTQLALGLMLRYPYRIVDINDALLNASGILIGYGIFRIFARLYVQATAYLNIRQRGFTAYIYMVAERGRAGSETR